MNREPSFILVIGIGNPCREDDGAGLAVADAVEQWQLPGVEVRRDYQLTVEDALDCASRRIVIVADASVSTDVETFRFDRVQPRMTQNLSSHALSPAMVAALCQELYNCNPEMYLLEIRGYSFDFDEGLTPKTRSNVSAACSFLRSRLQEILRMSTEHYADNASPDEKEFPCHERS